MDTMIMGTLINNVSHVMWIFLDLNFFFNKFSIYIQKFTCKTCIYSNGNTFCTSCYNQTLQNSSSLSIGSQTFIIGVCFCPVGLYDNSNIN